MNQSDAKTDAPLSNELDDVNSPKDNSNQTNLSHAASGFFLAKIRMSFIPSHTNDMDQQRFDSGLENTRAIESAQEFKFDTGQNEPIVSSTGGSN